MARGYKSSDIKEKLFEILKKSDTGLSGVEISEKIGINRITITKYLNMFAAEGLIKQKNIGNVTLWFVEEGTEQLYFPDDYFKVKTKVLEFLAQSSETPVYNLVKNSLYSGTNIQKFVIEVIVPAIEYINNLFGEGKIGTTERKHLDTIIQRSLHMLYFSQNKINSKKNCIVLAADSETSLLSNAASVGMHSEEWKVYSLNDMSMAIDVLFDLDLQKFLGKVWKPRTGIMIIMVFSASEEGLHFFAESINSVRKKLGKNIHLILFGKMGRKTKINADLVTEKIEDVFQWSETVFERTQT
ncbi:MAG: winged helix-turn-helix transcriptional regulator [Nitrosopumilaceae archaeon]|nr:helix-turn-helix domain-containing protein [Nitrosopumilaceae archaeon]NIU02312.1 helix-turn-helix domain-containing protein [Nitrosopumilaceae archaeon]NIU88767.1 winged helix-turn-helix transcriptional regulator [Nitrosopumilaceae archaeon]NIV66894.1 winged helix-turn-helix transcriptional regulator [Nitrosopumilaceae archaeon]NIX62913.1 winged helix-turn-helix transcriptional regulator [Nitrosopumilaceae archaeon]